MVQSQIEDFTLRCSNFRKATVHIRSTNIFSLFVEILSGEELFKKVMSFFKGQNFGGYLIYKYICNNVFMTVCIIYKEDRFVPFGTDIRNRVEYF